MFSPDSTHLAVADGSCYICVINMTSMTEEFKLQHPQDIDTREALQVSLVKSQNLVIAADKPLEHVEGTLLTHTHVVRVRRIPLVSAQKDQLRRAWSVSSNYFEPPILPGQDVNGDL